MWEPKAFWSLTEKGGYFVLRMIAHLFDNLFLPLVLQLERHCPETNDVSSDTESSVFQGQKLLVTQEHFKASLSPMTARVFTRTFGEEAGVGQVIPTQQGAEEGALLRRVFR